MDNLLLKEITYEVQETAWGTWKRFLYPGGQLYQEFVSHRRVGRLPLLHFTSGKCPETGRLKTAVGVVAIGRRAKGVLAIGQMAFGLVTVGQLSVGLLLGLGQASTGLLAVGQASVGGVFAVGQVGSAYAAIAQFGLGAYVLAQFGWGDHVWDMRQADPQAVQLFTALLGL